METLQDVLRRMLVQHLERQAQRERADRETRQNSSNPTNQTK
jgi:hypothetical protein